MLCGVCRPSFFAIKWEEWKDLQKIELPRSLRNGYDGEEKSVDQSLLRRGVRAMQHKKRWLHALDYISAKLVGSGFVSLLFIFVTSGINLYDWSEIVGNFYFWFLYVYAILFSMLVDLVLFKLKPAYRIAASLFLYILGGFAPFIVLFKGELVFTFIAGTVGMICAFFFYATSFFMRGKRPYSTVVSILILIILVLLATIDFSVKKQWVEIRTDQTYEASFKEFHGEHDIPIRLEQGETLTFKMSWNKQNEGGYGMSVVDRKGKYVGLNNNTRDGLGSDKYSFTAVKTGIYRIKLTGDHLNGGFKVIWEVDSST